MGLLDSIILALGSCSQDMAAAFLAVCLAAVRILSARCPSYDDAAERRDSFLRVYNAVMSVTAYSTCLIVFPITVMAVMTRGASPVRLERLQNIEMAVKYGLILSFSVIWLFAWLRLSKKVTYLKTKHNL